MSEKSLFFSIYYITKDELFDNRNQNYNPIIKEFTKECYPLEDKDTREDIETFKGALDGGLFERTIKPLNPEIKALTVKESLPSLKFFDYMFDIELSISLAFNDIWNVSEPKGNAIEIEDNHPIWRPLSIICERAFWRPPYSGIRGHFKIYVENIQYKPDDTQSYIVVVADHDDPTHRHHGGIRVLSFGGY